MNAFRAAANVLARDPNQSVPGTFVAHGGQTVDVRVTWTWNDPAMELRGLQTQARNAARRAEITQASVRAALDAVGAKKPRKKLDQLSVNGGPLRPIKDVEEDEERTVFRLDVGNDGQ